MSDRRVRRVLATGSVGNLPLEILRVIWQEVYRAGRRARRALRRHITKIQVVNAFHGLDVYPDFDRHRQVTEELRRYWQSMAGWTPRQIRNFNRRPEIYVYDNDNERPWPFTFPW